MDSDVAQFVGQSGQLVTTTGVFSPDGRLRLLQMKFEVGALQFSCDEDTDEILVSASGATADAAYVRCDELAPLSGLMLDLMWEMHNHRGYADAFQLRFRNGRGREETVQLEVAGSALYVSFVGAAPPQTI